MQDPTCWGRRLIPIWSKRRLGDIAHTYSGGTPSVSKKEYYGGMIPFIRSAEINSEETQLRLTEAGLTNSSAKMVQAGQILFALYGATAGEVGIARVDGAINQAILALDTDEETVGFLAQWLQMSKRSILDTYLQGGQGNLSGQIVKDLEVVLPAKPPERGTIGGFFATLDALIAANQRKAAQLEKLKRAYLQRLFPARGDKAPRLRFLGCVGDWRRQRARHIFSQVVEKGRPDLPVISATQDNGVVFRDGLGKDIRYDAVSLPSFKVVHPGDFIISLRSFQGGFELSDKLGIGSPAYSVFVASEPTAQANLFWKEFFKTPRFIELLKTITYGIRDGRSISFSEFGGLFLACPPVREQEQIGSSLHALDRLIQSQKAKVARMHILKQAYLQKMFA